MDLNSPKCNDIEYINFLIAASNVYSCTEAAIYTVSENATNKIKSEFSYESTIQNYGQVLNSIL